MAKIINVPDPILRKKSKEITRFDSTLADFLTDLADTLINKQDPPGVGLSAIQVGQPIRAFYTYLPKEPNLPSDQWSKETLVPTLHLNPTITEASDQLTLGGNGDNAALEGCLSIPKLWGPVYRHAWISITYYTAPVETLPNRSSLSDFSKTTTRYTGFAARVVQHEQDHLDGILFTDRTQNDKMPLYFDTDDGMQEIADPTSIINW